MKRFISLTLALLMVLGAMALTACKKNIEQKPTGTTNSSSQTEDPGISADERFDVPKQEIGRVMTALTYNSTIPEFGNDKDESGDSVNYTLVQRDNIVKEHLGIEMKVTSIEGQFGSMTSFIETVTNTVFGNVEAYDIIGAYCLIPVSLMVTGIIEDLNTVENVDFSKTWWSDFIHDAVTLNNKTYFMSGELSANLLYNMQIMLFNTGLLENYSDLTKNDLYSLVDNDEWTIDRFFEIASALSLPSDTVDAASKIYAIGMSDQNQLDSFYIASGLHLFEIQDGALTVSPDTNSNKVLSLLDKVKNAAYNSQILNVNGGTTGFKTNMEVFTIAAVKYVKTDFNEMKNIGLLPFPKYSEDDSYHTLLGNDHAEYFITSNVKNKAESGAFLETLAYAGSIQITPDVYYRIMKQQYSKDPASSRMFDIIRAGTTTEFGILSYNLFEGGNAPASMFRNAVLLKRDWVSYYKELFESPMTKVAGQLNAFFED